MATFSDPISAAFESIPIYIASMQSYLTFEDHFVRRPFSQQFLQIYHHLVCDQLSGLISQHNGVILRDNKRCRDLQLFLVSNGTLRRVGQSSPLHHLTLLSSGYFSSTAVIFKTRTFLQVLESFVCCQPCFSTRNGLALLVIGVFYLRFDVRYQQTP